jgi:integrase
MPAQKRHKTGYAGVYFIWGKHIVTGKPEKIFYITYRKDGKLISEKAGRASEDMTPARASTRRALRISGKELSNSERRAKEKAAQLAQRANDERWTISKLWNEYCATHADNKALAHEKRKFDLYIKKRLGPKEPSELLPLDVDRLRIELQKKGKRTTAARILELLRRTINFGIKKGLVPPVPFKIEIPRLNNQTTEDLNQKQLKALLAALDVDEDQAAANIMRLALFTGMRRSEILKLKWTDIDFERGFISIADPKCSRDQAIPLNDAARKIILRIEHRSNNPYVFPGRKKASHLTDCREAFNRIRKAAELPTGFRPLHGLRHVYASMLASSGKVDMYTLQKLLTHKSPIMTQRYAHLRDEALKRASDVAAEIIETFNTSTEDKDNKVVNLHDQK